MTSDIEKTLDHILFLSRRFRVYDAKYIAKIIVLNLGVQPKYDGFRYLVQAIILFLEAPVQLSNKNLYLALVAIYNGTVDAQQIEQSIRSAIRQAWNNRDDKVWCCYFPVNDNGEIARPSNGDFIATVACVVDLWKGRCRNYDNVMRKEEGIL